MTPPVPPSGLPEGLLKLFAVPVNRLTAEMCYALGFRAGHLPEPQVSRFFEGMEMEDQASRTLVHIFRMGCDAGELASTKAALVKAKAEIQRLQLVSPAH